MKTFLPNILSENDNILWYIGTLRFCTRPYNLKENKLHDGSNIGYITHQCTENRFKQNKDGIFGICDNKDTIKFNRGKEELLPEMIKGKRNAKHMDCHQLSNVYAC